MCLNKTTCFENLEFDPLVFQNFFDMNDQQTPAQIYLMEFDNN